MKRFSKTLPITKGNLTGIPEDSPAVIRINTAEGRLWCAVTAKPGRIAEQIWALRGDKQLPNLHFQYRTTATMEEAAEVRRDQLNRYLLPSLWRREQRRRRREAANAKAI